MRNEFLTILRAHGKSWLHPKLLQVFPGVQQRLLHHIFGVLAR